MNDQTDRILAALDRLERGQGKLSDDVAKLENGLARLSGDVAKLENGLAKLSGDVAKLENGQAKLGGDVARLDSGLAKLINEVLGLRTDMMARMDRLQNGFMALRDDIGVNFGAAESVRRANDNTRDELRALGDVMGAMQRQIQRLQTDVRGLKGDP